MMEPFEMTPRSGSGLQGETMMPVQSESEDSSEEETDSEREEDKKQVLGDFFSRKGKKLVNKLS